MGGGVVDLLGSLMKWEEGVPTAASFEVVTALVSHLLPCRLVFEDLAVQLVKDSGVAGTPILLYPTPESGHNDKTSDTRVVAEVEEGTSTSCRTPGS